MPTGGVGVRPGIERMLPSAISPRCAPGAPKKNTTVLVINLVLFPKALLAGFIVAVPIGAIGAMCLRRALQGRWVIGLTTGFGAALADAMLATAAMLGLTLLTHYLLENQRPVLLVGGVFLIFIGIRMLIKRRPKISAEVPSVEHQLRRWKVWSGALHHRLRADHHQSGDADRLRRRLRRASACSRSSRTRCCRTGSSSSACCSARCCGG